MANDEQTWLCCKATRWRSVSFGLYRLVHEPTNAFGASYAQCTLETPDLMQVLKLEILDT